MLFEYVQCKWTKIVCCKNASNSQFLNAQIMSSNESNGAMHALPHDHTQTVISGISIVKHFLVSVGKSSSSPPLSFHLSILQEA